eukprot:TRINITY_DN23231_c0_g1_i2.p1 TRINITY_DN23231_c0_g1~~TRINITY_DN23231_c0_g1_i2.p1  ORF type:complete len:293 (-),score=65.08 TRINITY_DN23231_c0_g1_i2:294-1172(-)
MEEFRAMQRMATEWLSELEFGVGALVGALLPVLLLLLAVCKMRSTRTPGTILSLWSTGSASKPMNQKEQLVCVAGVGVEGDRYSLDQESGRYSCLPEPGRQLTLIAHESITEMQAAGHQISPENCRRNTVVQGLDLSNPQLLGSQIRIGSSVRLFVHRPCAPCMYLEGMVRSKGIFMDMFGKAGLSCEILEGGIIRPGDHVEVDSSVPRAPGKCHTWSAAKLTAPQLRTEAQKREVLESREKAVAALEAAYDEDDGTEEMQNKILLLKKKLKLSDQSSGRKNDAWDGGVPQW